MNVYLDSSAAVKLLVSEPQSESLFQFATEFLTAGGRMVSSRLLLTELYRVSQRINLTFDWVDKLLFSFDLFIPDGRTFQSAGLLPGPGLRSLDAIHVATAIQMRADVLVTYDLRMQHVAQNAGIKVESPGWRH